MISFKHCSNCDVHDNCSKLMVRVQRPCRWARQIMPDSGRPAASSVFAHTIGRHLKGNRRRLAGTQRRLEGHRRRVESNRRRLEGNRRRLEVDGVKQDKKDKTLPTTKRAARSPVPHARTHTSRHCSHDGL